MLLPLALLVTSLLRQMGVPGSVLLHLYVPPPLTNAPHFPAPSLALRAVLPTLGPCPPVSEDPGPLPLPLSSVMTPGIPLLCAMMGSTFKVACHRRL